MEDINEDLKELDGDSEIGNMKLSLDDGKPFIA